MSDLTGARVRAVSPVDSDPVMDEALRRARLSAADRVAHDAASYVRPDLSPRGLAALARLTDALGVGA
jgi:hypothetical protein